VKAGGKGKDSCCSCDDDGGGGGDDDDDDDSPCDDTDKEVSIKNNSGNFGTKTCAQIVQKGFCNNEVADGTKGKDSCCSCDDDDDDGPPTPVSCDDQSKNVKFVDAKTKNKSCKQIGKKKGKFCQLEVKGEPAGTTAEDVCPTACKKEGCEDDGPPVVECKEVSGKVNLKNSGKNKCKQIVEKGLCDEKVKNKQGKTAADFCQKSCQTEGCGGGFTPDSCDDESGKFKLKGGGKKNCKQIGNNKNKNCQLEVKEGKPAGTKAEDVCPTTCKKEGCDVDGPSPPLDDDSCLEVSNKVNLVNSGKTKCKQIAKNNKLELCDEKVKNKNNKTAADFCQKTCKVGTCTN